MNTQQLQATLSDMAMIEQERKWKQSVPSCYEREHYFATFPEVIELLKDLINIAQSEHTTLETIIRQQSVELAADNLDDVSEEFIKTWWKVKRVALDSKIAHLKQLLPITLHSTQPNYRLPNALIEQAKAIPIQNLITEPIKQYGDRLKSCCPLHNEKTASFTIYTSKNTFYCFGCNKGGDVIAFVQLLHSLTFREAVQYLIPN
ncbi:MAG: CHC2 zinc finger domain-containing protein [Patescibacteria group bacterium]|jgi:hypothetical protein